MKTNVLFFLMLSLFFIHCSTEDIPGFSSCQLVEENTKIDLTLGTVPSTFKLWSDINQDSTEQYNLMMADKKAPLADLLSILEHYGMKSHISELKHPANKLVNLILFFYQNSVSKPAIAKENFSGCLLYFDDGKQLITSVYQTTNSLPIKLEKLSVHPEVIATNAYHLCNDILNKEQKYSSAVVYFCAENPIPAKRDGQNFEQILMDYAIDNSHREIGK